MDFKGILHNKLFLYGAGAVGLFVLIRLLMSGASGTTTTVATTSNPTDAMVNAQLQLSLASMQGNNALALAQVGAASTASQTSASLAAATQTLQEQLAEKGVDADVAKYSIATGAQVSLAQINAAQIAQERDDNLQASIAKWTLETSLANTQSNNNFQLAYASNANATTIATAQIIAGVNLASIEAARDTTIASIQGSAAQTASYIAGQVAINDSNNSKDIAASNNAASVQKHGQTTGMIGGIVGGILGIFSDRRLKTDVILLGRDADGLGHYAYRYTDSLSVQVGVMADEVRRYRPHALGPMVAGYDTVNYRAL